MLLNIICRKYNIYTIRYLEYWFDYNVKTLKTMRINPPSTKSYANSVNIFLLIEKELHIWKLYWDCVSILKHQKSANFLSISRWNMKWWISSKRVSFEHSKRIAWSQHTFHILDDWAFILWSRYYFSSWNEVTFILCLLEYSTFSRYILSL